MKRILTSFRCVLLILFVSLINCSDSPNEPDDSVLPDSISDLEILSITKNSVFLTWTATGDDGSEGTAASYDIRYSLVQITENNWEQATIFADLPAPSPAGSTERFLGAGLSEGQQYYFAIKAVDDAGNWSPMSNTVYDVADGDLLFVGHLEGDVVGDSYDLKLYGNYAVMAANGISVVDISDPFNPELTARHDASGGEGIFIQGDYAYLAGLRIYELDNAGNLYPRGSSEFGGINIVVKGNYAYTGRYIFDVSDKDNVILIDSTENRGVACEINGDYAFFVRANSGGNGVLSCYSLENAPNIQLTDSLISNYSYSTLNDFPDIYIANNNAYVAGGAVVEIVDIQNPYNLTSLGIIPIESEGAEGVCVRNDTAFVVEGSYGLEIFDISNITSPELLAEYDLVTNQLRAVRVKENYIIMSYDNDGLLILQF